MVLDVPILQQFRVLIFAAINFCNLPLALNFDCCEKILRDLVLFQISDNFFLLVKDAKLNS